MYMPGNVFIASIVRNFKLGVFSIKKPDKSPVFLCCIMECSKQFQLLDQLFFLSWFFPEEQFHITKLFVGNT